MTDRPGSINQARADGLPAARRRRRSPSITNRLRWSYLISSTLPLVLVGALLIGVLFQAQRRNAYDSQQAVADQIAGNISTFLYDLEQLLLRAAYDLRPADPGELLTSTARRLVSSSPDLRALIVVDVSGRQVASATSTLLNDRGILIAPVNQRLIDDAIGVGQGGRTPIAQASDGTPYFQVVLPIRDQSSGTLVGAMSAEVSAARITQILRLGVQGEDRVAYLLDSNRQLMLGSRTTGWSSQESLAVLFGDTRSVGEYDGVDGTRMVGAHAVVSPVTSLSWSVVIERPAGDFFTDVYRSMFLLTALVCLVGLLALGWAFYQSRRIVNPVRALAAGAQQLGAGQLSHRISVGSGDELGQLADTFNHMAARLQASLYEIAEQNDRLRHGLALARDIQMGLLPSSPPWKSGLLTVAAQSIPASEVGGDFYTYLALPSGHAAVAIGDISGKGVAAALLMALTSSTLESQVRILEHPGAMLVALHAALQPRLLANQMNAALQIAIYDPEAQRMTIANAGMIAPLLVRPLPGGGSECGFVDVSGLPIGTRLPAHYAEVSLILQPGDTLLFLSDGIVEAHNRSGELYGFERLEALVARMPDHLDTAALIQHVLDAVLAFVDGADPHDDITILATRPAIGAAQYEPQLTLAGMGV